jgi:alkyldihydroxyacetonephosphate synthase
LKLPFSPGASPGFPTAATQRIEPSTPAQDEPRDAVRNDGWGFVDTAFGVTPDGHITVTGSRYPGLSGQVLPNLLPWFRRVIAVDFPLDNPSSAYPPAVDEPRSADRFFAALDGVFTDDQVSTDAIVRLRRGHGHTVAEMDAVRSDGSKLSKSQLRQGPCPPEKQPLPTPSLPGCART